MPSLLLSCTASGGSRKNSALGSKTLGVGSPALSPSAETCLPGHFFGPPIPNLLGESTEIYTELPYVIVM